ncbi:succinyl-diaminopimelate desuccinylase [Frigidibacter sp. MR17.14]|uniref:succinyl-diaminopimelate desuccinylase n=1 Tax=Frigidibacter sp. MR17.14 TaxID=3126509 RepID=UPI003012BD29
MPTLGNTPVDPVALTAELIRCPSVTPVEGGALVLLDGLLTSAGFACTRIDREGVPNLYARWGEKGAAKTFGFNGHTDVVPVGDADAWTRDPFGGEIVGTEIWGRGATDMKSGVAAFVAAACDLVREAPPAGAIAIAITGDEEGPGKHGTKAMVEWMEEVGERMSVCLVGEPTCPETLGDMIKIGRRGSMTVHLGATGVQGHAAYPHRAKNPLHALVALLEGWTRAPFDEKTDHFDPSTLQIVTIDCGNPATNVIPAKAHASVNIRFNDRHSSTSVMERLRADADRVTEATGVGFELCAQVSGESFLTPPGPFVDLVAAAVTAETGLVPELSTTGGTSDARFLKDHCPVLEFGLVGKTMHQVDERVETAQIDALKAVYRRILTEYFA